MSANNYIKVTLKGDEAPRIVKAALKNYFISQGAKIETPTAEEVAAEFPEERKGPGKRVVQQPAAPENKALLAELAEKKSLVDKQANTILELEAEIVKLKKDLNTKEVALEESEALIAKLRSETPQKKSASKKEEAAPVEQ